MTAKYLPALKCLLAAQSIDPEHPKCHELSGRLRLALERLGEHPLPEKVKSVLNSEFLSKVSSKSVEASNEEYLAAHKDSATHVHAAVRLRNAVKSGDATQSVKDLRATLGGEDTSWEEAKEGLYVLHELGASEEDRTAYTKAANERWPEVDVFSA